jgi:hypothetical protein
LSTIPEFLCVRFVLIWLYSFEDTTDYSQGAAFASGILVCIDHGDHDMGVNGNGVVPGSRPNLSNSIPRQPRRLVLLADGEQSEVIAILREYRDSEVSGNKLHADLQTLALDHQGQTVAAEWPGPLGWTRFLWCRK